MRSAVVPSWDQLGKLGAISAVRTFPNYFLMREMEEEEQKQEVEATNV